MICNITTNRAENNAGDWDIFRSLSTFLLTHSPRQISGIERVVFLGFIDHDPNIRGAGPVIVSWDIPPQYNEIRACGQIRVGRLYYRGGYGPAMVNGRLEEFTSIRLK